MLKPKRIKYLSKYGIRHATIELHKTYIYTYYTFKQIKVFDVLLRIWILICLQFFPSVNYFFFFFFSSGPDIIYLFPICYNVYIRTKEKKMKQFGMQIY